MGGRSSYKTPNWPAQLLPQKTRMTDESQSEKSEQDQEPIKVLLMGDYPEKPVGPRVCSETPECDMHSSRGWGSGDCAMFRAGIWLNLFGLLPESAKSAASLLKKRPTARSKLSVSLNRAYFVSKALAPDAMISLCIRFTLYPATQCFVEPFVRKSGIPQ